MSSQLRSNRSGLLRSLRSGHAVRSGQVIQVSQIRSGLYGQVRLGRSGQDSSVQVRSGQVSQIGNVWSGHVDQVSSGQAARLAPFRLGQDRSGRSNMVGQVR